MKSTLKNMTAVLFGITLVASAGVGVVNMITAEPIAAAKEAATVAALNEVLPAFDETTNAELTIDELPITVYTATKEGVVSGYAVQTMTKQGFGGTIRMMVGFTPDGEVVNVNVLEQSETPGLGTKMTDEGNPLITSFKGKNPADMKLAVKKDGVDHFVARLCRCHEPCMDSLQERIRRHCARRRSNGRNGSDRSDRRIRK